MPFHVEKDYLKKIGPEIMAVSSMLNPPLPKEDALGRRSLVDSFPMMPYTAPDGIEIQTFHINGASSDKLEITLMAKKGSNPGDAVVFFHGGGLITGKASSAAFLTILERYVQNTGVPFLTVNYGLAPENPGMIPAEDGIAAVQWMKKQAAALGIDPSRIAVMGESAGGCIAAGTAILARDTGIQLAKQILIYPMLDDRNTEYDENFRCVDQYMMWKYDSNYAGWYAHVGDKIGDEDNSPVVVPARNRNFDGMAEAYLEVGELDIFRDEVVAYASHFWKAGISAELHVWDGMTHGFDGTGIDTPQINQALWFRYRAITSF